MDALFLFCCEPCLRGDDDSREFYEILAVEQSASSEDIRSAYRRRALELHPDKLKQKGVTVTSEHNEQFNRLKDAYDVLGDPKRRRIYDRVGEAGLSIVEGKAGSDPALFLKNLKKNKRAMFRIALLITALFGLLVLQPILLILKIDDIVSGSWFAIWVPMLLVDAVFVLNAVTIFCMDSEPPEGEDPATWVDPYPFGTRLWISWTNLIFVLAQIFILLNLDDAVDWSWAVAFIPWMIYEANQLIEVVPAAFKTVERPEEVDLDAENGEAEEMFMHYVEVEMEYNHKLLERYSAQESVVATLMRVLFLILLAVKLDSSPSGMTWSVVFIPFWLYFSYKTLFSCYLCQTAGSDLPNMENVDEEDLDGKTRVQLERAKQVQAKGFSGICFMIVPLVTAIVLVVHLQHPSQYDVAVVFIPLFIVVGLAYLITLCAFYAVVSMAGQDAGEAGAPNYTPPQADRDTDDSTTPFHPNAGQAPVVVTPAEPAIVVVPPADQANVQQAPAQEAESAHHEQEAPKETHIDLDVD